jgi:hypothetical protein
MWLTVNGQSRQKSSTKEMIFDVAVLVSYLSRFMTLLPGDVISTGTPAGVGLGMTPPTFLKPATSSSSASKASAPNARRSCLMKRFGQLIGLRPERSRSTSGTTPRCGRRSSGAPQGRDPQLLDLPFRRKAVRLLRIPRARGRVRGADARARARAAHARVVGRHDPMQAPVEGRDTGGWWANMEEVFHTE